MVKTKAKPKSDVERILEKIKGEKKTISGFLEPELDEEDKTYFLGKFACITDLETWIQENILEEE